MFKAIKVSSVHNFLRHLLLLLILYLLQAVILPWFGTGALPLLLAAGAAGIAHAEGSFRGALFGLFAGMLTDSALGRPILLFTLTLTLIGLILGWLSEYWLSPNFLGYMVCCAASVAACSLIQMFPLLFFRGASFLSLLLTALLQLVTSLIASAVLYPIIRGHAAQARRL